MVLLVFQLLALFELGLLLSLYVLHLSLEGVQSILGVGLFAFNFTIGLNSVELGLGSRNLGVGVGDLFIGNVQFFSGSLGFGLSGGLSLFRIIGLLGVLSRFGIGVFGILLSGYLFIGGFVCLLSRFGVIRAFSPLGAFIILGTDSLFVF